MKAKNQSTLLRNQYDIKWLHSATGVDILTKRYLESLRLPMDRLEMTMDWIISVVALASRIYLLKIDLILVVYKFPWYLISVS